MSAMSSLTRTRLGWAAARAVALLALGACSGRIAPHPLGDDASNRDRAHAPAGVDPTHGPSAATHTDAGTPGAGGGDTLPDTCAGLGDVGAPMPLRRLNASHVERTVADVLGVQHSVSVTDERLFTYRSNVATALDATGARGYLDFAEAVAADADLSRCASASCLDWLLDDIGLRLFRRPLAKEQRDRYSALYDLGAADGARWVLEAMLQSPSFVYLDEVAGSDGYLDDYAIAARLALMLWGSNPDMTLLMRASQGGLSSVDDIRKEATRMLADPRSDGGVRDFVDQWLGLQRLADADARPDLAALGSDVVTALRDEPVRLFRAQLARGGNLTDLLTTSQTARLDPLAAIYGSDVTAKTSDAFMLDPARRAGILSLPGVMAALSHARASSPTLRGYAVLASFLCTPPPPPPANVNPTLPEVGKDATPRQRLEAHFKDDSCGACHRAMDGIGFAFERIDWLGKSRTQYAGGGAIDDTSMFALGGADVHVNGAPALAAMLAHDDDVAACVARQWARYATGIPDNADARCLLQRLGKDIAQPKGLSTMMITYVTSDWFRRKSPGVP